ncbi:hypothetical protein BHE74_00008630 [Ensete ventricosum]|nr:hypothetical protein BHE74_00008630 [Ensete ventricosum]
MRTARYRVVPPIGVVSAPLPIDFDNRWLISTVDDRLRAISVEGRRKKRENLESESLNSKLKLAASLFDKTKNSRLLWDSIKSGVRCLLASDQCLSLTSKSDQDVPEHPALELVLQHLQDPSLEQEHLHAYALTYQEDVVFVHKDRAAFSHVTKNSAEDGWAAQVMRVPAPAPAQVLIG